MNLSRGLSMHIGKNGRFRPSRSLEQTHDVFPPPYSVSWGILQAAGGSFQHLLDQTMCYSPSRMSSYSTQSSNETSLSLQQMTNQSRSTFSSFLQAVFSLENPPSVSTTSLRDQLRGTRIEWPKETGQFFVPRNAMKQIITPATIYVELGHSGMTVLEKIFTAWDIWTKARKLFAILVLLEKGHLICDFLKENIGDADLPLQRSDPANMFGTYKLCSKLNKTNPVRCMVGWDSDSIIEFSRQQRYTEAPIFEYSESTRHYELDDNCVLPFTSDEMNSSKVKEGGFSTVWKVDIHPAHHNFEKGKKSESTNNSFALKKLHSNIRDDFEAEVEVLRSFNMRPHPNLIRLLCTFRYKQEYYLLFPYAESNLRQYWQDNPSPDSSKDSMQWMLKQCKAIASGLHKIHEYRNTNEHETLPKLEEEDRVYGRHGDIKAENILFSLDENSNAGSATDPGTLLIADFGLTDLHRRLTRSFIVSENINGTPSYEPPERDMSTVITRKYDIWSLGCLFLEFLIWRIRGWEELMFFQRKRTLTGIDGSEDQRYYSIDHPKKKNSGPKPSVRKCVQKMIDDLRKDPQCSNFDAEFLGLISRDMLIVDVSERISSVSLNVELSNMVKKAESDSEYFTRGSHRMVTPWSDKNCTEGRLYL